MPRSDHITTVVVLRPDPAPVPSGFETLGKLLHIDRLASTATILSFDIQALEDHSAPATVGKSHRYILAGAVAIARRIKSGKHAATATGTSGPADLTLYSEVRPVDAAALRLK